MVDSNGKQLTMVNFPKMALINVTMGERERLILSAPEMPDLTLTCPKSNGLNNRTCKLDDYIYRREHFKKIRILTLYFENFF